MSARIRSPASELPGIIKNVHATLGGFAGERTTAPLPRAARRAGEEVGACPTTSSAWKTARS